MEEGHSLYGSVLTDKMVGLGEEGKPVVYTGEGLALNEGVERAELEFSGRIKLSTGEEVLVKTAFTIFKETAFSRSVEEMEALRKKYEVIQLPRKMVYSKEFKWQQVI
ncbi:MAG: hypothetical protein QXM16_01540 [Nitrososphaerota archaeon]